MGTLRNSSSAKSQREGVETELIDIRWGKILAEATPVKRIDKFLGELIWMSRVPRYGRKSFQSKCKVKIISLNVGRPRLVSHNGEPVSTGIFKDPIASRVMMRALNLDGDRQADLSVHGGPSKAVYVYPAEHYEFWKGEFPEMDLPWGMFGENFTTTGLLETETNIGDKFRIGAAVVMVTQPRMPCYKLGLKFGRADIIKRFLQSERTGFYLAVFKEGEVGAGDEIEPLAKDAHDVRVSDITRLYTQEKHNAALLRRAIEVQALPETWRGYFQDRLEKLTEATQ